MYMRLCAMAGVELQRFIKIVDGENLEFSVPAHHDGFTVGIDAVNIAARGYGAAKETATPYSALAPVYLAGSGFHAGHDALIVPEEKFLTDQQGRGDVRHAFLNTPDLLHLIAFRAKGDDVFELGHETAGTNDEVAGNDWGSRWRALLNSG